VERHPEPWRHAKAPAVLQRCFGETIEDCEGRHYGESVSFPIAERPGGDHRVAHIRMHFAAVVHDLAVGIGKEAGQQGVKPFIADR